MVEALATREHQQEGEVDDRVRELVERVVRDQREDLLRRAKRRFPRLTREDCEDCLQVAILNALARCRATSYQSAGAYLALSYQRILIDHVRSAAYRREAPKSPDDFKAMQLRDGAPDQVEQSQRKASDQELAKKLGELRPMPRDILYLRFVADLPAADVQKALQINRKQYEGHLTRGLKMLGIAYQQDGDAAVRERFQRAAAFLPVPLLLGAKPGIVATLLGKIGLFAVAKKLGVVKVAATYTGTVGGQTVVPAASAGIVTVSAGAAATAGVAAVGAIAVTGAVAVGGVQQTAPVEPVVSSNSAGISAAAFGSDSTKANAAQVKRVRAERAKRNATRKRSAQRKAVAKRKAAAEQQAAAVAAPESQLPTSEATAPVENVPVPEPAPTQPAQAQEPEQKSSGGSSDATDPNAVVVITPGE